VLLGWVQAGYALEALAKGAMDLSRRFTLQELQERWRALLYDPAVAVEASRKLLAACGQAAVLGDLVSRPARRALLQIALPDHHPATHRQSCPSFVCRARGCPCASVDNEGGHLFCASVWASLQFVMASI
jgi:hypothetical protein